MAKIECIRNEYFQKGKSISEIAKEHGCDRKTVRKYINKENWNEEFKPVAPPKSKLDPYKTIIDRWLEEDRRRWKKQRHTAKRVFTGRLHSF